MSSCIGGHCWYQDMAFFDDPKHSPGRLTAALATYALKMNAISGVQLGAYTVEIIVTV